MHGKDIIPIFDLFIGNVKEKATALTTRVMEIFVQVCALFVWLIFFSFLNENNKPKQFFFLSFFGFHSTDRPSRDCSHDASSSAQNVDADPVRKGLSPLLEMKKKEKKKKKEKPFLGSPKGTDDLVHRVPARLHPHSVGESAVLLLFLRFGEQERGSKPAGGLRRLLA